MAERMITCERCGALYKESMRYCMKCGKLNYNHPDNVSMLKYEHNEDDRPIVYNSEEESNKNSSLSFESPFKYVIADKAGNKTACIVLNSILLVLSVCVFFFILYSKNNDMVKVVSSNEFYVGCAFLVFWRLESMAMQFLFMKANRPWWKQLIPVYNLYILNDIATKNKKNFFLTFIPVYGIYVVLKIFYELGKKFGYAGGVVVLFPIIAIPSIAFNTAVPYNSIFYISRRKVIGERVLEEDHQKNVNILFVMISLIVASFLALIFFNFKFFWGIYERGKLVVVSKNIVAEAKKDIRDYAYTCSNNSNILNSDGTYYVPFGIVGYGFGEDFFRKYGDYRGYVKLEIVNGEATYFISVYDSHYGLREASLKDIKKGNVEVLEKYISEVPEGAITCYKN